MGTHIHTHAYRGIPPINTQAKFNNRKKKQSLETCHNLRWSGRNLKMPSWQTTYEWVKQLLAMFLIFSVKGKTFNHSIQEADTGQSLCV